MTDKITNHTFIRGGDGRCAFTYGSGADRERCGNAEYRHANPSDLASGIDQRPHSRACGITQHAHGPACSTNCPTCGGMANPEPEPFAEDSLKSHESTKRVLYHLVNSYQTWRDQLGMPNEFTDDAVRIGEQHLREVEWFPEDEGWLVEGRDASLSYDYNSLKPHGSVLDLIDAELARLKDTTSLWGKGRWRKGVIDAREAAALRLQDIRDAYVLESLTRETESLRLYGIKETDDG